MKMMKYLLAPSMFLLASTACSSNMKGETSTESKSKEQTKSENASAVNGNGKTLVVFFSHAGDNYAVGNIKVGNTKKIADIIAEKTGADQFEIVAEKNYDMAYGPLTELAKKEQQDGELPAFKGEVENIDQYQTIFIGGPVWWGTYPQVMFTFFKKYDLNGKTLIPFTTHEGSGLGNCVEDVKAAFPNATVKEGLAIRGKDAQEGKATKDVEEWLDGLGL